MTITEEQLPPLTFDPGTGKIHTLMVDAMRSIGAVAKEERNQQQNFNFRGIDTVINTLGPVLREKGIFLLPLAGEPIIDNYATKTGTAMCRVILPVTVRFMADDGSYVECRTVGESADAGDKATTKAHSVALRTALLQTFVIPTDEADPDSESHERADEVEGPSVDDLTSRGWESQEALESSWVELRDATKGDTDALKTVQGWVRKQEIKKGTFTASQAERWEAYLSIIDVEGNWIDGKPPTEEP